MQFIAAFLLVTLPWLNAFNPGPTASVGSLLVSWACAAGLLLLPGRQQHVHWRAMWPMGSLALLLAGAAIGSGGGQPGADALALAMSLLVMLACAVRYAHATPADTITLARALLLAGLASVVMGWMQYVGATDAMAPWVSSARLGEAFGNLRQRNLYASLTSIALGALVCLARIDPWFRRPARLALPAALLAAGNALSLSRTGLFELLVIMALAWVWGLHRERAVRWALAPVLPAYLTTALGLPLLFSEIPNPGIFSRLTEGAPLCSSRMTLWSNVLELIGQHPWVGWGWGQLDYAHYITLYQGQRFCDILDNAHNLPLHLAVELGLPMALLVCGAGLSAAWRAQPWTERDPRRQMAWVLLTLILLHSLLEYPLWYGPFQMTFGICLGLLWPEPRNEGVATIKRLGTVILSMLILGGVVTAAWDYHRVRQIYLPPEERSASFRENTLDRVHGAWLFRDQVRFAELTLTPLTRENAEQTLATATALLHFSPEPRVIEKVIESAVMLGQDDNAMHHLLRYRAAFPKDHAQWAAGLTPAKVLGGPGD